jgi:signal transduction histidine kinase/ActR/RegA family two-component response regulator
MVMDSPVSDEVAMRLLVGQQQVLGGITRRLSLPDLLISVTQLITGTNGVHGAAVLTLNPDRRRISCVASTGLPADLVAAMAVIETVEGNGSAASAIQANGRVVTGDLSTDPAWDRLRGVVDLSRNIACWSEPVYALDGLLAAVLDVYFDSASASSALLSTTIDCCAKLAAIAIDFGTAARGIAEREVADDELRAMATHARCMLWHGEVTGLPGWETHGLEYDRSLFRWQMRVQDEFAAQQLLPLEIPPGENYGSAWIHSRFPEDDVQMWNNAATALMQGRPGFSQEFRCRDRSGNVHWLREDLTLQPLGHGHWRVFGVVTEITEQKHCEEELRHAKETAEAASHAKDRFLAMLSHELRTPLTPVLATVNLVESRTDLSPDLRADLLLIRQNVEMEARLIDDLLDITRVNRGKVELRNETVDAHDMIRSALQTCSNEAEAKLLEISLHLDARLCHVWADAARLQQVFWNLLKNAIKFTPPGGRIEISSINAGSENPLIEVDISDTGIGIDAEVLPRLFDEFEQGGRAITQRYGGLGLGLAISKALVQIQGGTLTASSAGRDRGATFKVMLPTSLPPAMPATAIPAVVRSEPSRSAVILLVDDHPDTLNIMSRLLRHVGYQVVTAGSVATALAAARQNKIDLLVSDIGLPDGSGLDIMRGLGGQTNIKGIALSGFGMDDDHRKSRDAGFSKHLTKPIGYKALAEAIRDVLEQNATRPVA